MNNLDNGRTLEIPHAQVGDLIARLGLPTNELSQALSFSAIASPADSSLWWDSHDPAHKPELERFLRTVAAPALVATLSMLCGDTTVLLRLVVESSDPTSAVYLLCEPDDPEQALVGSRLEHRDRAVDVVWDALVGDFPLWEMASAESFSRDAFFSLLAAVDLHQRKEMVALLNHTVLGPEMFPDEIQQCYQDALEHSDLRWLVPFFVTVLPDFKGPPTKEALAAGLEELVRAELLESSPERVVRWSPKGLFWAQQWQQRLSLASLQILGAAGDGSPVASQVGFVRGQRFFWYLDFAQAEGTVMAMTPPIELMKELLDELLIPLGVPRPLGQPRALSPTPVQVSASAEAGASSDPLSQARFCPFCGGQLAVVGAKFCNSCGQPLELAKGSP